MACSLIHNSAKGPEKLTAMVKYKEEEQKVEENKNRQKNGDKTIRSRGLLCKNNIWLGRRHRQRICFGLIWNQSSYNIYDPRDFIRTGD